MYHQARELFGRYGFEQLTVYDWEKPRDDGNGALYEECTRDFEEAEMFGWGFAAVSEFPGTQASPGWTFMNPPVLKDYYAAIDQNRLPTERGYNFMAEDRRLSALFRSIHGMKANRTRYRETFGVDLLEEHAAIWQALVERNWAAVTEDQISTIGDGVFYTPMIQTLLAKKRVEAIKGALVPTSAMVTQRQ